MCDGYTLDGVTHVCYSAQTIARQKFYTSQMGPNFQRKVFYEKGLVFKTTFGWIEKLVERKILLVYNAEQPRNTILLHAALIEQILNAYQKLGLKVTKSQRVFSFSSHFQKCVQNHCFCIRLKNQRKAILCIVLNIRQISFTTSEKSQIKIFSGWECIMKCK